MHKTNAKKKTNNNKKKKTHKTKEKKRNTKTPKKKTKKKTKKKKKKKKNKKKKTKKKKKKTKKKKKKKKKKGNNCECNSKNVAEMLGQGYPCTQIILVIVDLESGFGSFPAGSREDFSRRIRICDKKTSF